jgi:aspartate/methionine/tyrosine aminotransferase
LSLSSLFSTRTAIPRQPNRLTEALERARLGGGPVLDLTVSNPTTAGISYAKNEIIAALATSETLTYIPSPLGLPEMRQAIAATYREIGVAVDEGRIVPVASTSEAYSFLAKLLCDSDDEILVPSPSYPLFDLLGRFEGVRLTSYPLAYDGGWHIEVESLRRLISPRTRAIFVVTPNNPTGSYLKMDELRGLAGLGLPIVSDEVFSSFPLTPPRSGGRARAASVLAEGSEAGLVFALSGLSKLAALPQMKLAWICVGGGDREKTSEALERLELLSDTFLSVGTPVQLAASQLLATRGAATDAIRARLARNLTVAAAAVRESAVSLLDVEGGWYATLRLPGTESDEAWALSFLQQDHVYVHPGHFFDFADGAYAVVSLLTPEAIFSEGMQRLVERVESGVRP